jgi:hypothetical protein
LEKPEFFDVAGFLYGCLCPESEIIAAKRDVARWDKAVYKWINKVEYEVPDIEEALATIGALLAQSEKGKVRTVKAKTNDDVLDEMTEDPNE